MLYNNTGSNAGCSAVMGSMTSAMKAQRLLSKHALRSSVIKISPSTQNKGCIYGIEFDCAISVRVRQTLSDANIDVKEYLR